MIIKQEKSINSYYETKENRTLKLTSIDQNEFDIFNDFIGNKKGKDSLWGSAPKITNELGLTNKLATKPVITQSPKDANPTEPLPPYFPRTQQQGFNAIDPHDLGKLFSHFYGGKNNGEYWGVEKDDLGKLIKELDDPDSKMSKFIEEYNKSGKPKKNFDRENINNALKAIKYEFDKGNPSVVGIESWTMITLGDKIYRSGNKKLLEHSDIRTFTDFEDTDFPTLDGEKEAEANKLRRELINCFLKETKVGIDQGILNSIDSMIFSGPDTIPAKYTLNDLAKIIAKFPTGWAAAFFNDTLPPHFEKHIEEKFKKVYKFVHGEDMAPVAQK